jgi:tRNA A37 threonylcarbamoyladenosine dehydratase
MDKSNILKAFNDHFVDFLNDIQSVFPNDSDIQASKTTLLAIKKINPRLIIKIWNEHIVKKYKNQILNGDLSFFIDKDYSDDLNDMDDASNIANKINKLREPIKNMGKENQDKCMKYIQNLTKLSELYN